MINPYDWFIADKEIDGAQCTIAWYVDVLKLSHKCSAMMDESITSIRAEYGRKGEMTVRQGKTHDYEDMTLDFSVAGKFTINMENYIEEVMKHLHKEFDRTARMTAADYLLNKGQCTQTE